MKNVKTVSVKGTKMKPKYKVSEITNRTNKNLWVVFPANKSKKGIVYASTYSRDYVRNAASKVFNTSISDIRSQRVSNFRKNYLSK